LLRSIRIWTGCAALLALYCGYAGSVHSRQETPGRLSLRQAGMCEAIEDNLPKRTAVVFSVSAGRIFCFTHFDPVSDNTHTYHDWYHKDRLIIHAREHIRDSKFMAEINAIEQINHLFS